jgi:TP901 family phage tail tape measure protein
VASAIVGALKVILSADTAQYDSAMKAAGKEAANLSREFGTVGKQMTAVGSALTKTITLPLLAVGAGAIKVASDFESSFAGVRKTVDATEPEFAQLAQGLRNMAKEIPVNVNELNKVAEAAGQLGIKKDDILQFTRTMADLGVTTNLTADEAATATAQFQNIFGAAGKDVDKFGATLVALGNAGASTEKDIINMGLRIAGAGNQIGLSQHQVMSFASALSSVGINAEAGGSAISRVFLKINDAVMKGGDDMREFARVAGMSGAQFKQAFETDAATATTAFITGLARLKKEGENTSATLEGLVGKNFIIKDTLMRAAGAGELLSEQLAIGAKAWQDNTALTVEAEKRYKTFASQVQMLWNQVRDLGIELGTALLPAMQSIVSMAGSLIPVLETLVKMFTAMPSWVQASALGFGALAAAIGPVLWVMGQLITSIGVVVGAFGTKGVAMKAVSGIMGSTSVAAVALRGALMGVASAVGVAAAAFAGWQVGKAIGEWTGLTNIVGYFSAKLGELVGLLPKGAAAQYTATQRAMQAAEAAKKQAAAIDAAAAATNDLGDANAFVGPILDRNANSLDDYAEAADEAKKKAEAFAESLRKLGGRDAMAGAEEVLKQLRALGGPLNVLPGQLDQMADKLREAAQAAALMGKHDLAGQYTLLAKTLSPVTQFQQRYNVTIGEYVPVANSAVHSTEALWEQFYKLTGQVQTLGPVLESIAPAFAKVTFGAMVPFKEAVKEGSREVVTFGDTVLSTFEALPSVIMSAIQGGGDLLAAAGSHIGTSLMSEFQTTFGPAIEAALPFGIGKAVTTLLPMLGSLFGPALRAIGGFFRDLFGGPNADELAGRELVAKFEANLHEMLNDQQLLEAGNESWKKTVIAIRDAYIKQGLTAEQAMAAAEKLWASSRSGAAASAAAIAEIERVLRGAAGAAGEFNSAIDNATRDRTMHIGINVDEIPNLDVGNGSQSPDGGFASGTMGRLGKWFSNFGSGFNTSLHGLEAVVTPSQAPAFAMDVLGAAGISSGNTSSPTVVDSTTMALVDEMRYMMRDLPRALKLAVKDAGTQRGVR